MLNPTKRHIRTTVIGIAVFSLLVPMRAEGDEWWGADKALHLGVSTAIASASYAALWGADVQPRGLRFASANAITIGLGTLKEAYDATRQDNYFSGRDLVWDVVGSALGSTLVLVIDMLISKDHVDRAGISSFY